MSSCSSTIVSILKSMKESRSASGLALRGAKERLAPILMTAATAGLGLVPLVIIGDVPGQEIVLPTAIVILGGLVTSTLLTLFVVPSLYLRFGRPEHALS